MEISKYQIRWVIIDTRNTGKVFKYQIRALNRLGFSVFTRVGETPYVCKHYRSLDKVLADKENIRRAFSILNNKREGAEGSVITDAQYGRVEWRQSPLTQSTKKQMELFCSIINQ